jgi:nucleoside-diphosphate-sugar epimerase
MPTQPEHVAVIGGGGFIGRYLTGKLRAEGCSVTVVSRSAGGGQGDQAGIRYFRSTVADAARISEAIAGSSVVYDLSMGGGATWADYERDFIQGARNVAAACRRHGVRRLIYTSSISAIYLGRSGKLTESGGTDPRARERSFYSRGKAETEKLLLTLHRQENLPVVILRPAIVLGAGGMLAHGALGISVSSTCILGWGRGRKPLPCVLARDVAEAMALAKIAQGVEGKTFNLAGDIRPTAEEFVQLLRERTKRNFRFYPRSLWAMGATEWLLSTVKSMAGKPPERVSYRDLQSLTMAANVDCSAAKHALGWKPESDPGVFFREAIDVHLKPLDPDDLRLETEPSAMSSLAR